MRTKRESTAWREFAEFIAQRDALGEQREFLCNYLGNAAGRMCTTSGYDFAPVARWPRKAMLTRILSHIEAAASHCHGLGGTLYDDRGDNTPRVLFCLLMAEECRNTRPYPSEGTS